MQAIKPASRRPLALLAGLLYAALGCRLALADDTEIFFSQNIGNVPANVLFILDTSGSMNDTVTSQLHYDSTKTYTANKCSGGAQFKTDQYYFVDQSKSTSVPSCGSTSYLPAKLFKCAALATDLATLGKSTSGFFIQWGSSLQKGTAQKNGSITTTVDTTTWGWGGLSTTNTTGYVECKADAGKDGDGVDKVDLYATADVVTFTTTTTVTKGSKGSSTTTVTSSGTATGTQLTGIWDAPTLLNTKTYNYFDSKVASTYVVYSGNYLNYLNDSTQTVTASKISVMQASASNLLASLNGVNVGVARYDQKGNGGMILAPIGDLSIGTNRDDRIKLIKSWSPDGVTPLTQTLYEAYLYFSGGSVYYGDKSYSETCTTWSATNGTCTTKGTPFLAPSVASSRTGGSASAKTYDSPADYSCRKNFIVFLTDGLPNETDTTINPIIKGLPNMATLGGACDTTSFSGQNGGLCTGALAQYMYNSDLRADVAKVQNVTSYFIGFGADFTSGSAPTAAFTYLQNAATRGGGKAYTADSLSSLTNAFDSILADVIKINTTFTAPAVAVNAFNRTQTLNDLYVSVFSPRMEHHWPGNVKKYKLSGGQVVDSTGAAAVDAGTGFFLDTSQSFWSKVVDGADVNLGGAASRLPDYAKRTIYTTLAPGTGSYPNLVTITDSGLKDADFNIVPGDPALADVQQYTLGQDLLDQVAPTGTTDTRHQMGDPLHTQPVVVIYGKLGDGSDDTVIYVPDNDGMLHAIDGTADPKTGADTSTSGTELWAYAPYEMLAHFKDMMSNFQTTEKHYGLDGSITVLKYDANGDGTVNGNDKVILYFSTGRNSDTAMYYALDVTDKANPKLLWQADAATLPGLGEAWSQPTVTRVNISGATQNSQHLALVIGGGYDASENNYTYNAADAAGKGIYIVDALYGKLLWHAGPSGADFNNARMDHAIPAQVQAIDLDGDGYADRLYVGDMAAQLWRLDLTNGQPRASFATGGVIASLGTHDDTASHPAADQRRFYSTPDLSAEQAPGQSSFINIAIGSGYRGHPLDASVHDRFYSVRDYDGFANQPQKYFDNYAIIRDSASGLSGPKLTNITTVAKPVLAAGAPGWQLDLDTHSDWTAGEKSLAPSRTFNSQVIFTTYSPSTKVVADPCAGVGTGTNRVYAVDVMTGAPLVDRNKDGTLTTDERSQDLRQGGIAPETAFLFTKPDSTTGVSNTNSAMQTQGNVTCLSGVEVLGICSSLNRIRKTYWLEGQAN